MTIDPSQNHRARAPSEPEPNRSNRFRQLPSQFGERIQRAADMAIGLISSVFNRLNSLIRWGLTLLRGASSATSATTERRGDEIARSLLSADEARSDGSPLEGFSDAASSASRPQKEALVGQEAPAIQTLVVSEETSSSRGVLSAASAGDDLSDEVDIPPSGQLRSHPLSSSTSDSEIRELDKSISRDRAAEDVEVSSSLPSSETALSTDQLAASQSTSSRGAREIQQPQSHPIDLSSSTSDDESFVLVQTESRLRRSAATQFPLRWQSGETFGQLSDALSQLDRDLPRSEVRIADVSIKSLEAFQTALQPTPFRERAEQIAEMLSQALLGPAMSDLTARMKDRLDSLDPDADWMPVFRQKFGAYSAQLRAPKFDGGDWSISAEIDFQLHATSGDGEEILLAPRIKLRSEVSLPPDLADEKTWDLMLSHRVQLV